METTEELWDHEAELDFRIEERLEERWEALPSAKRKKLERRAVRKLEKWRSDMARLGARHLAQPTTTPLAVKAMPPPTGERILTTDKAKAMKAMPPPAIARNLTTATAKAMRR